MKLEHDTWELRLGHCLKSDGGTLFDLDPGAVDHTICDPPYSRHVHENHRSLKGGKGQDERELGFEHLDPLERHYCAQQFARLTRRWILVCCDLEGQHAWQADLEGGGAQHVRFGLWLKKGATPQITGDRPANAAECLEIAHAAKGRLRWNGGGSHAIWPVPIVNRNRRHTTEKPLALMEALVRDFTEPGDLVLDPFAGSATTGVACLRLGRRFLGWELSEECHADASKRLASTPQIPELFVPKAKRKRHKQAPLDLSHRPPMDVACEFCGAKLGTPCRSRSSMIPRPPHKRRLVDSANASSSDRKPRKNPLARTARDPDPDRPMAHAGAGRRGSKGARRGAAR